MNLNFDTPKVPTPVQAKAIINRKISGAIFKSSTTAMSNLVSTDHASAKMGSRRIFTPQFKLQVLESYRNDNDCKGNQRATARKYNIHRRQIQKWLQCESNLRSSVANINQSNVKHQFHNISHHQEQQQLRQPLQMTTNKHSFFGHHHVHHLHQQHLHKIPSDEVRENAVFNSIAVSSMRAEVDSSANMSTAIQDVFAPVNIAAVVAAASAGTIVKANTSAGKSSTTTSILRPTSDSSASIITQPMLHPHHHHYALPYTHTPANSVPVSVPVLSRHIPPQHLTHPYSYQRHNFPLHSHMYSHAPPHAQQPSIFMPSKSLSVNVLSEPRAAATSSTTTTAATASAPMQRAVSNERGQGFQKNDGLRELPSTLLSTATRTKTISTSTSLAGNTNVNTLNCMYRFTESGSRGEHNDNEYKGQYQLSNMDRIPSTDTVVKPMDLSLNSRCEDTGNLPSEIVCKTENILNFLLVPDAHLPNKIATNESVVDLTFRKRRVIASSTDVAQIPEKMAKLSSSTRNAEVDSEAVIKNESEGNHSKKNNENGNKVGDNVDVEVAVEENSAPPKAVKLFKPYLLDNDDNKLQESAMLTYSEFDCTEQREPIIWSNHPGCLSPYSYESPHGSSRGSNFQSSSVEKNTLSDGSSFQSRNQPLSSQSAFSPTSSLALSPTGFLYPKGSPVSGYESSSSTYSEPTCRSENEIFTLTNSRNYCVELQMYTVCKNNMIPTCESHVQNWLDQGTHNTANSPAAENSIALYS